MRLRPWRDDVETERTDETGAGDVGRTDAGTGERAGRTDDRIARSERAERDRVARGQADRDRLGRRDRADRGPAPARAEQAREQEVGRDELVETTKPHFDLGSVLATAAGVALTVIGILALVRTGIDSSWYEPVEQIASVDHTAMLGAIEVGVGVLLILAGLAGARMFAALVALVAGIAAAIVAIEPSLVDDQLALERGWATALAVAGLVLALLLIMTRERREERRVERRSVRHA